MASSVVNEKLEHQTAPVSDNAVTGDKEGRTNDVLNGHGSGSDNGDGDHTHSDNGSTAGLTAGGARDGNTSGDADGEPSGVQGEGAAPLNKKQKAMRHFRKWWWAYLIGLIIFLAILLPILFELIIPAIVQDIVSSQSLPVHSGTVRALSPSMVEISLNTTLNTAIPARLGTFPLSLYAANATDIPFVNLTLQGQHISKNTPVIVTNQTVPISNETELVWWLDQLYDQTTVGLGVDANPEVFLGILHSQPHLKKTLEIPGLNMLSGIAIEGLELIYPPMPNGYNINGTLLLPNSGVLGLGLGNLSFNLLSGDVNLGLVHLYDVTLLPGNTSSYFEGELYIDTLLQNIGPVLGSQADPLGRGVVTLNATGNATMINGEHITYIENVLNRKTLSLDISAVTLLSDVVSGLVGAGNASLITALTEVFDNKTFFSSVLSNWEPPLYYGNESRLAINQKVKAKRSAARNAMVWNMFKFGANMKNKH